MPEGICIYLRNVGSIPTVMNSRLIWKDTVNARRLARYLYSVVMTDAGGREREPIIFRKAGEVIKNLGDMYGKQSSSQETFEV